ncbi:unnamed protein product [Cylicocyclus nassatus]|uniref:Fatty-acid and retinol-binding protein 1 n=1 Tax=Cylicocyclus nassatus TaxID=53992 RepID=A0AA36M3K7_CYLNA|nr:unnamed protein product [Cylicocyclus nassatus]
MFQITLFFALFVAYTFSAPAEEKKEVNLEGLLQKHQALIPENVATKLKALPAEKKAVLEEIVKVVANYKTEDKFLKGLMEKEGSMKEKITAIRDYIRKKVAALGDEAKAFVKKVAANVRKLRKLIQAGQEPSLEDIKEKGREHIGEFDKLSKNAKEELEKNFPIFTTVFTSEKVRAMFNKPEKN